MPAQTSPSSLPVADPAHPIADPPPTHTTASFSHTAKGMISTITSQRLSAASGESLARHPTVEVGEQSDHVDSASSSLSDLDDAAEERADTSSKHRRPIDDADGDSEAETDVLTPRKTVAANLPANGAANNTDKSPSKLTQELLPNESSPPRAESAAVDGLLPSSNLSTHTLSPSPSKDAQTINIERDLELSNRKRKRTASLASSLSEMDEPLAKRRSSSKHEPEAPTSPPEDLELQDTDAVEPSGQADEDPLPEDGATNGASLDDASNAPTPVPTMPLKGKKGKKGRKKVGRKPFGAVESEAAGEPSEVAAEDEAEVVDVEVEEEGSSIDGEVVAKKRSAMDAFNGIEKEFAAFRERHLNEQLLQINRDLDLLRRELHPEYLTQQQCIDKYRDTKLRRENAFQGYKNESLRRKIVAERTQLHSQYFQEVRDLKEKMLERCYKDLYVLQKDRRRWGADETNYNYLYNPNRTRQIQEQASYNLEVSILAGVAKHVGFPAAPDINGIAASEIESDFAAMAMPSHPGQARILLRDAERTAGENGFFEQNVWANPSVANAMLQSTQPPPNTFTTPQAQKRAPELPATNGSNSTVDLSMMSAGAPTSALHGTPHDLGREMQHANSKLASLGNGSKAMSSRLQDGTERIHTTHNSARGTPTAQEPSLPLPPPPEPPTPSYPTPARSEQRDIYASGIAHAPMTAAVGVFPP